MDGRDGSGLSAYFNTHHHHFVDGSAAGDAHPFAITHPVSTRPSAARPSVATAALPVKRKRGRPRKYGTLPSPPPLSLPTSAMTAAAKVSPSTQRSSQDSSSRKKGNYSNSLRKAQLAALGKAGQGFTPHVIIVSAGEDVVHKIVSMMQQGKRAFSIFSATGSILNPTLCQPAASSGGVTYEGKFEIISLSGLLIYNKVGGTFSRTSGLVTCLSGVDGHLVGGSVEGPLMADGPVQVIAGSFLIDTKTAFSSASTKVGDYTNNMSTAVASRATLVSPVNSGSSLGLSRGILASQRSDDHQSMSGSHYLFQSQPLFSSLDWEGRHITGTSQSADEEDEEDIGQ